jgi:dipeptidyl aminopeptidase/acylaminoacyl peptidase
MYCPLFSLVLLLCIQVVMVSAQNIDSFAEDLDWNEQTGQIALGYVTGELTIVDATTLIETTVIAGLEHIISIDWHPVIADRIAVANTAGEIFIVDTTTATIVFNFRAADYVAEIAWHPQGDRLAGSVTDRPISPEESTAVEVWNAITGADVYLAGDAALVTSQLDWSPDGNTLAYAIVEDSHAAIRIVDAVSGTYLTTLDIDPELIGAVSNIAWSDDNRLSATIDTNVLLWDTADWSQLIILEHDQIVSDVTWSPDNYYLAYLIGAGEIRVIETTGFNIVNSITLEEPGYISMFDWDASGERIIYIGHNDPFADGEIEIVDLATVAQPTPTQG